MGNRARQEMQAAPGRYGGEGMVTAGWVCGIVGTVLLVASAALVVVFLLALGSGALMSSGA
jgi:hypothetical protein